MLYLLALLLPPVAVLIAGKPVQALLNVLLTVVTLWIGGVIHAFMVVNNYYADKRTGRLEKAIRESAGPRP